MFVKFISSRKSNDLMDVLAYTEMGMPRFYRLLNASRRCLHTDPYCRDEACHGS